jgi:hypothetical protein
VALSLFCGLAVTVGDDTARKDEVAGLRLELNRNLYRIEDVGIEFRFQLPMDANHPGIVAYTKRIEPMLHSLNRSLSSSSTEATWGSIGVSYISKSPLFPDLETERIAYTFLSHVGICLEIFADSDKAESFASMAGPSQGAGDLVFHLNRSVGGVENDVVLGIDFDRSAFSLSAMNAKTGPSQKSTGRIMSLPDLAGATGVMYFFPRAYRNEAEKREFLSIANDLQLGIFGLNFSGGQRMFFEPEMQLNKYGEQVYIFKFPKTTQEVEALIQR